MQIGFRVTPDENASIIPLRYLFSRVRNGVSFVASTRDHRPSRNHGLHLLLFLPLLFLRVFAGEFVNCAVASGWPGKEIHSFAADFVTKFSPS